MDLIRPSYQESRNCGRDRTDKLRHRAEDSGTKGEKPACLRTIELNEGITQFEVLHSVYQGRWSRF